MLCWSNVDSFPFIDKLTLSMNHHLESFWEFPITIFICLCIKNDCQSRWYSTTGYSKLPAVSTRVKGVTLPPLGCHGNEIFIIAIRLTPVIIALTSKEVTDILTVVSKERVNIWDMTTLLHSNQKILLIPTCAVWYSGATFASAPGEQQQSIANPHGRVPRTPAVTAQELIFKPLDLNKGLSSVMSNLLKANMLREQIVTAGKSISSTCSCFNTVLTGRS